MLDRRLPVRRESHHLDTLQDPSEVEIAHLKLKR
jgi:hypothetical protein